MRKKFLVALITAVMTFSLTACQGISASENADASDSGDTDSSAAADDSSDEEGESLLNGLEGAGGRADLEEEALEQELYNTYIEVNNHMVGRITDSLERYFDYVDLEEEFQLLDEDYGYFDCYSISDYQLEDVENAWEMASAKQEKSDLDQAFLDLYPSLKTVILTLNDISEYTDMKSYLDDDYERAGEYHATLVSALEDYFTAGDAFMAELNTVATERQNESLARMKEEGYEVFYAVNMVMSLGNQIESELYSQDVWDENILDMDLEVIQPLYDEFVTYVEAVLEYSKDDEKLQAEGIPIYSAYWSSFLSDMKNTKTSLTEVLQKVKNGEALSEFDLVITSIPGDCSLSSFDAGLSAMINDYNHFISY